METLRSRESWCASVIGWALPPKATQAKFPTRDGRQIFIKPRSSQWHLFQPNTKPIHVRVSVAGTWGKKRFRICVLASGRFSCIFISGMAIYFSVQSIHDYLKRISSLACIFLIVLTYLQIKSLTKLCNFWFVILKKPHWCQGNTRDWNISLK